MSSPIIVTTELLDALTETSERHKSSAKELLAALKVLADDYESLCGDGLTESNQPIVLRVARAAIRKAEGRG